MVRTQKQKNKIKMAQTRKHSCKTASETLEWISSIVDFLKPYKPLMDAHVVNFFKDRLWESIDEQWMDCLCAESVENLLKLPSGAVQDHWPASLKDFILTLRSLVLSRNQGDLQMMLPDLHLTSISSILAQGMNPKKKHEVETLAALVNSVANSVGAQTIVDVGAGQGYLAQVLTFQYQFSVVAIDASSHHGTVTSARAARIRKHYAAKMRKSQTGTKEMNIPQTVAVQVLSSDMLKALSYNIAHEDIVNQTNGMKLGLSKPSLEELQDVGIQSPSCNSPNLKSSLVLAGLHACGDLSVTMLRTFLDCEEVKAVISIGCCYNLLSEEGFINTGSDWGFPMSHGVKLAGFSLGRSARDLGCQSAERWKLLDKDAAFENFNLHGFRAAFQMILDKFFPEVLAINPSIGRQGKALRRQQATKIIQNHLSGNECCKVEKSCEETQTPGAFEKYCESGLNRLGLRPCHGVDILELWKQSEPFMELIGPYWTIRACLGPLVETLILLDRLLFLQEKGSSVEAVMIPIFDPALSPRNVAIIAKKM